jgi:hypothetical protein
MRIERFARKKGGRKGGAMRAANLTAAQLSESGRKAAAARWAKSSKKPARTGEQNGDML